MKPSPPANSIYLSDYLNVIISKTRDATTDGVIYADGLGVYLLRFCVNWLEYILLLFLKKANKHLTLCRGGFDKHTHKLTPRP